MLANLSEQAEPQFASTIVSDCSVQCKQQPVGVVTLEKKVVRTRAEKLSESEPRSKRRKTMTVDRDNVVDSQSWIDLAR